MLQAPPKMGLPARTRSRRPQKDTEPGWKKKGKPSTCSLFLQTQSLLGWRPSLDFTSSNLLLHLLCGQPSRGIRAGDRGASASAPQRPKGHREQEDGLDTVWRSLYENEGFRPLKKGTKRPMSKEKTPFSSSKKATELEMELLAIDPQVPVP